jgi:hypothetical protein
MTRKPAKQITKREIAAIHSFYAPAFDRVAPEIPAARAPRTVKPRTEPSEAEILKAIMALLKRHPKVAKVWRQNSGVAQYQYGSKTSYVRFNSAKGMSDILGILKTGRTLAIEVKNRTRKVDPHQQQFLDDINAGGGLAFVARSVDDVIAKLGE